MRVERVVVDTNVLISAALRPKGTPRAVIDTIQAANGVLLFSNESFHELQSRILAPYRSNAHTCTDSTPRSSVVCPRM